MADDRLQSREFNITVLGRLLEHLGGQMYKRRHLAIAELVANSWDAGAKKVTVKLENPSGSYDRSKSRIVISDSGCGMTEAQVEDEYLVVGRNRRSDEGTAIAHGRRVMGRKGIGKLAGFGIARRMTVITWRDGRMASVTLNVDQVKKPSGEGVKVPIPGKVGPASPDLPGESGTQVILEDLKHKTPVDVDALQTSLARRYSRVARGKMNIFVDGKPVEDPKINWEVSTPDNGYEEVQLSDGNSVRYRYGFSKSVLSDTELQGFTVYVHDKTAQAPPFFFNVERTASGQHGTRYLSGEVHADFLDEGLDDEGDIISTDRQEIDWDHENAAALLDWGQKTTRKALRDWAERNGKKLEDWILEIPEYEKRVEELDDISAKQVSKFLRELGRGRPDRERAKEMADALIKAFEYRHFHDVVEEIEAASDDPSALQSLLQHLVRWKVLESRTILEVVNGRLQIIDKFFKMIVEDSAETAWQRGDDSMHDLIAQYPWLLNPEWQILEEEARISTWLRKQVQAEIDLDETTARLRFDFLGLSDERQLILVEIKRAGYPVTLEELQRFDRLAEALRLGEEREVVQVLVYGGNLDVSKTKQTEFERREDLELVTWKQVYARVKRHYEHYRAVLQGDIKHPDFGRKKREVDRTRRIVAAGTAFRGSEIRKEGVGESDVHFDAEVDEMVETEHEELPPAASGSE